MTDFGTQLRDYRVRVGMTQAELARASGLGQSTISALETGRQGPWPSTRRALAHAFHLTPEGFDSAIRGDERALPREGGSPLGGGGGGGGGGSRGTAAVATALAGAGAGAGSGHDSTYASEKVLELLGDLGRAEQHLKQFRAAVERVCAAGWTTDARLHVTGSFGPLAADLCARHGDFVGRHLSEFFQAAWNETGAEFLPLDMQQRAADGESVTFTWTLADRRYTVFIDPVTDEGGQVMGTVGIAVDVTDRGTAKSEPAAREEAAESKAEAKNEVHRGRSPSGAGSGKRRKRSTINDNPASGRGDSLRRAAG